MTDTTRDTCRLESLHSNLPIFASPTLPAVQSSRRVTQTQRESPGRGTATAAAATAAPPQQVAAAARQLAAVGSREMGQK